MSMSSTDLITPTTSLPDARLSTEGLQRLGLEERDINRLLRAGICLAHTIRHGCAEVLMALPADDPATATPRLGDLDVILRDPSCCASVMNYCGTFTPELQRQCREILNRLQLYWFSYRTLLWLKWQSADITADDVSQAQDALQRLGQLWERSDDAWITVWRNANPLDGRQRDPENQACPMVNHLELRTILWDGTAALQPAFFGNPDDPGLLSLQRFARRLGELV